MKRVKIFLSHSSVDKPLAEKIYTKLRDMGVSVWIDKLEMQPGDHLTDEIRQGIKEADFLIILVTENSNKSTWVAEEISIAQEYKTIIIPLVIKNCDIPEKLKDILPEKLKDILFVTGDCDSVDGEEKWLEELVKAIYRDSYFLKLNQKADLVWDDEKLEEDLHKYYRNESDYSREELENVRVYIAASAITKKLIEIAYKTISQPDIPQPVVAQITIISDTFSTKLPIFWINLSDITSQAINCIFRHYGKNDDAVKMAKESTKKILEYANYKLWKFIKSAIFAGYAKQFSYPHIAAFIDKYEGLDSRRNNGDEEKIVREIYSIPDSTDLSEVGLEGNRSKHIRDCSIFLPITSDTDRLMIQMTCKPREIITDYAWFQYCVPQIAADFLHWTAFREGKPAHELGYQVGICMDDYERVGLY